MADRDGNLVPTPAFCAANPNKRWDVLVQDTPIYYDQSDKRRPGPGISFPPTVVYYLLRARDNGAGPPAVYQTWTSTDPNDTPPNPPAPIGAWVETTIIKKWTVP
jgi:hypothetical protein